MRSWMPLWAVACLITFAVGTVWLRLSIVRTSYDINQADHQIRELQLAREYSTVKYTGLRSPRRLELLARTRFGLSQPRPEQVIRLDQEPTLAKTVPAPAAVESAREPQRKTAAKNSQKSPAKSKPRKPKGSHDRR